MAIDKSHTAAATPGGRRIELDLARGLAVLFMVLIHTQDTFSADDTRESMPGQVIDFLGGVPAAPVFMVLLGTGVALGSATAHSLCRRGLWLILTGYLLNLARGALPYSLSAWLDHDPDSLQLALEEMPYFDILQFAGLAMLIMALMKKWQAPPTAYALVAGLSSLLNEGLHAIPPLQDAWWISPLYGAGWWSTFPLLSWLCYPLLGYVYGDLLRQSRDPARFHAQACGLALITLLSAGLLFGPLLPRELGMLSNEGYQHHRTPGHLVFGSLIVLWFSLLYLVSGWLPRLLSSTLRRWSQNVTPIYLIHWVLIGWLSVLTEIEDLDMLAYAGLCGLILACSGWLASKSWLPKIA